jgi:zinc transporter ZupT
VQLLVGALGYLIVRASPTDGLLWIATEAASPFQIADALLAVVAGLIMLLVLRAQAAGAHRPRWPWERDDEP